MNKTTREKRNLENILRLQEIRNKLSGPELEQIDRVIADLRERVGNTVSKKNAAEFLQVSRQAIDKWIAKDMLPVIKGENGRGRIPRESIEKMAEEIRSLRDLGETRSLLAKALRSVADEVDVKKNGKPETNGVVKEAKKAEASKSENKPTAKKSNPKKKSQKKSTPTDK